MRRTMIMTLVLILVATVGVAWGGEEKDTHYQAAAELLDLAHMDQVLSETIDRMLDIQIQQNPQLEPYRKVMKDFFNKYMGWDALKEDFIKIYMDAFTEPELKDMIAFYKTPTGQKAIMKTPELAAEGAELGQKRVQDNISELIQMIQEEDKRLKDTEKMEEGQQQGEEQSGTQQQPDEQQNNGQQKEEGTQEPAQ